MSKGSKRRPMFIPQDAWENSYERTFGKPEKPAPEVGPPSAERIQRELGDRCGDEPND